MFLLRARGMSFIPFSILALLIPGWAICVAAQEHPGSQTSPPRTIILPQKLLAGNPATLAALDAAGRLKPSVVVQLSNGQKVTTDPTGRALFVAPSETGALTAKIFGQETTAVSTVVAPPSSAAPGPTSTDLAQLTQSHSTFSVPRFLTLHDRFTIEGGGFSGRADANHVFLADQPCLVVASSPLSLVVLPGLHVPIGPIALRVSAGGRDLGPFPVAAVQLEFTGPAGGLTVGNQSKLVLHVRGATERLAVDVRNGSPEIIQFVHGNVQRLETSGGEQNIASVDLKLLAAGNYIVTARLIPTESGLPDLGAVRQKLLEARTASFGTWTARIDQVIAEMDRTPEDAARVRADLKRILDDRPIGQLASLLDSAWQELQKNN